MTPFLSISWLKQKERRWGGGFGFPRTRNNEGMGGSTSVITAAPFDPLTHQKKEWESIEFNKSSFSEGSCRYAFIGTIRASGHTQDAQDGWVMKDGSFSCVVKVFKKDKATHVQHWFADVAVLKVAAALAHKVGYPNFMLNVYLILCIL